MSEMMAHFSPLHSPLCWTNQYFLRLNESIVYGEGSSWRPGQDWMPVCVCVWLARVCAHSMSGYACFASKYVCISVWALRGNSSLMAGGSSCRRAVFVQPGFVGISYPAHVWEVVEGRERRQGGTVCRGGRERGTDSERTRWKSKRGMKRGALAGLWWLMFLNLPFNDISCYQECLCWDLN